MRITFPGVRRQIGFPCSTNTPKWDAPECTDTSQQFQIRKRVVSIPRCKRSRAKVGCVSGDAQYTLGQFLI